MYYEFKYDVENIDIQKHIHVINKYGTETEKQICNELRCITWDMSDKTASAKNYLNKLTSEHIIHIALKVKKRNTDKDDWFMNI